MASNKLLLLIIPLAPLLGAIIAGLFCRVLGNKAAHRITILGVAISAVLSLMVAWDVFTTGTTFNESLYTWSLIGEVKLEVGFLIDRLTAIMLVVVTSVSLLVHIYTIGYMDGDPGYNRFFSYISLFTFSMLMLVMSNNFLQLFFGWEAVGLVSYLLIGFWYTRETAIYANLKAFLVNRVGDFGFLLGIGLVLAHFGTLDYAEVFAKADSLKNTTIELFPGAPWLVLTVICICLFIGAMGKSAQFPLHVWLPDSMEGPTPISALIHAATMVTAGIFMVARMSPVFELSSTALSVVMIVGAITAFFMALIAVVVYDIKRVVAYSTLSQLGYMTMALGASGYSAAIFHLFTHAFFKAALFLGAGSVIIAMHHEQDMRKMGGLRKYMPLTYITVLIGAWANAGLPPFAGFFSKESIVEVLHHSTTPGAGIAYAAAVAGVFIGAIYSFRLVFFAFHGKERMDAHTREHLHESPWVVTVPLLTLAALSICAGWLVGTVVHGDYFGSSIFVGADHPWVAALAKDFHGVIGMMLHGFGTLPLWLAIAGVVLTWYLYIVRPDLPAVIRERLAAIVKVLEDKYGFDRFNDWFFAGGARTLGTNLWQRGDVKIIDGIVVNGSARVVGWLAGVVRQLQTGRIYHYAFSMIIGALVLVSVWRYILPHFARG
jgi:NADH-quinone oxidoreductase subunit L